MKGLFYYANKYIKKADWKDLAFIKLCLCAIGIMLGIAVPKNNKKPVFFAAAVMFISTFIPSMLKFSRIIKEDNAEVEALEVEQESTLP